MPWKHPPNTLDEDGQQALAPNFTPITMDPLEQDLVLRYLRARCHPTNRLLNQNITFPPNFAASIPLTIEALEALRITSNKRNRGNEQQNPTHKGGIALTEFEATPTPLPTAEAQKRKAVSLDCEMVTLHSGSNEVAFLSVVDVLTSETLINSYVMPSQRVRNWNTRTSGITAALMNRAGKNGQAIMGGWKAARQLLWNLIDAETVVVGHSIQNDLNVLGMYHSKIVDSSILTAEAVFVTLLPAQRLPRTWSLKTLAKELLGYNIQNRRSGHSALEDACAARDVVIWCIRNPEELKVWAEGARKEEEMKEQEREFARQQARDEKEKERKELEQQQIAADLASGRLPPQWSTDSDVADGWGVPSAGTEWAELDKGSKSMESHRWN